MAHSIKMPFFHGVTDHMNDEEGRGSGPSVDTHENKQAGDGLHHHEMHEDEGGGYHSKHTHPDGRVEHKDHASYDEAKSHMDAMHGQAESEDQKPGRDPGDDFDSDDMAGSYGRAADCE